MGIIYLLFSKEVVTVLYYISFVGGGRLGL